MQHPPPTGAVYLPGPIAKLVDLFSLIFILIISTGRVPAAGCRLAEPEHQYVISMEGELEAVGIAESFQNWLWHAAVVGVELRRHAL